MSLIPASVCAPVLTSVLASVLPFILPPLLAGGATGRIESGAAIVRAEKAGVAGGAATIDAVSGVTQTPVPERWCESVGDSVVFADGLHAALRSNAVERGVIEVPLAGHGSVTLELRAFRVASPGLVVELGVEPGAKRGARTRRSDAALAAVIAETVHFEGSVAGFAHSSCYLAIGAQGAAAWVDLGEGRGHFTLRRVASAAPGLVAGRGEFVRTSGTSAPDVPSCGGAHAHGEAGGSDGGVAGFGGVQPGTRRLVDLAIDMDHDMRAIFPDNASAAGYAGALVGAVSAIYRRDCDATIRISYLRILDTPDDIFNDSDPLYQFRDYWNTNGAGVSRDLFTLFTGRRDLPYGGVAWLNAVCGGFGYSVNGYLIGAFTDAVATNPGNWDINVVAHELGHNLGTQHTHYYGIDACASGAVQRGTIMSYCHVVSGASSNIDLRFHRGTAAPIEALIAGAACLSVDCDEDGLDDALEIAGSPALDTNFDGILDACQDCDGDGMVDPVEIELGLALDTDGDQIPDACEEDCDADGKPDSYEIALDPGLDADGDFVLDACQPDCNANGIADSIDINADMSLDRSRDGRIDACEDCDGDGEADFDELKGSRSRWVASSADNLIRELDPRSGVLRRTVDAGASPRDLAIGPDGRLYLPVLNEVRAFDRLPGSAVVPWAANLAGQSRAIAVAPNGQMAVLLDNGTIVLLNGSGGFVQNLVTAIPGSTDARDLVFRTAPGGATEAIVTREGGVVHRVTWPGGVRSVFCDLSSLAPSLRGAYAMADGSILVAASALNAVHRIAADGTHLGAWDVDNGALVNGAYAITDAGDGRAVLVTGPASGSTINGFNLVTGYTERTYRVYPADAPAATAIVVAPPSSSDQNGNLVPDNCEPDPADLNGDGSVNAADLALLLGSWGACSGSCAADLNGDGTVGAADLSALLNAWG